MKEKTVKAKVHVTLKNGVLDPQGKAVEHALGTLGFEGVGEVRIGKYIELELTDDADKSKENVEKMCKQLLANTVIENFDVEIVE
jgi:phosphoribosylformylglycinamidine synthase PurS subunit